MCGDSTQIIDTLHIHLSRVGLNSVFSGSCNRRDRRLYFEMADDEYHR